MTESTRQGTTSIVAEISEREMTKMIGTGGIVEKMIAETASEMIGGADAIVAARQITIEAARVTEQRETIGERDLLRLLFLLRCLTRFRGVPVVGTSDPKSDKSPESKAKREAATADALARAKAMVEAQQKKSAKSETEAETKERPEKEDIALDQEAKPSAPGEETSTQDVKSEEAGEVQNKKRTREDDYEHAPEAKKIDTKAEPLGTNGHS
jgi:hypothetical protein